MRRLPLLAAAVGLLLVQSGCMMFPDVMHAPTYHNPFPQLARVAVMPFNNLSTAPHVDGQKVAEAYFNELQKIPGFEVVPPAVVVAAMRGTGIQGNSPQEVRQLGAALGVDVVVVGAVTQWDPYYPPRLGLAVDWYATNPCFHPIPPGYGLPWGTAEEEFIPESLVQAAEFALAREQLKTQTPRDPRAPAAAWGADDLPESGASPSANPPVQPAQAIELLPAPLSREDRLPATGAADGRSSTAAADGLPPDWPDPRGFVPPRPATAPPPCRPTDGPVIEHIKVYNGHDADLTTALEHYYYLQDDGRFGGWQSYLQRSDDFIRFCCHLHITEMLAARGGAGKTRVVYRWPIGRYER